MFVIYFLNNIVDNNVFCSWLNLRQLT